MHSSSAILTTLVLLFSATSAIARSSVTRRTFSVCNVHSDCIVPDVWSILTCNSGACVNTCKSGCKATSTGCGPTTAIGSCVPGQSWNPVTRSCMSTISDPLHCGAFENACPTDPLGTAICSNSSCSIKCNDQTVLNGGACVPSTPSHCGLQGKSCPNPLSNGAATCNSGTCSQTCNPGYIYDANTNDCVMSNTPTSCGLFKTRCPTYTGTTATCVAGICGSQCTNGGVFNPLTNSCTSTANRCGVFPLQQTCPTVANGQSVCNLLNCMTVCNDGYVLSSSLSTSVLSLIGLGPSSTSCVPITNNNNVCGLSKTACSTTKANCISTCTNGSCVLSGKPGYTYNPSSDSCIATASDPINCGCAGYQCYAPANGQAFCKSGSCSFTCNPGFNQVGLACKAATASPLPRKKRSTATTAFYCPQGEEACPVIGSQSLAAAMAASKAQGLLKFNPDTKGGYECIDTQSSLESCGGCASIGAGQDCTKLPHASSMGCSEGKCVIFKCSIGFVANKAGTKCIRLSHHNHNATTSHHKQFSRGSVHDLSL